MMHLSEVLLRDHCLHSASPELSRNYLNIYHGTVGSRIHIGLSKFILQLCAVNQFINALRCEVIVCVVIQFFGSVSAGLFFA